MKLYRVVWEIDVEADDAVEAAWRARELHCSPDTTATIYTVRDKEGHETEEDLKGVD